MRIHLSLKPSLFGPQAVAGPSSSPMAQLGGEVVLIELQGELGWEGEKDGGVVGVIGLDRPDKPTLHLGQHHLLHGKFANLPKPLAVIRRAVASGSEGEVQGAVQGDADEEEEEVDEDRDGGDEEGRDESRQDKKKGTNGLNGKGKGKAVKPDDEEDSEDDEDDGPLFPPDPLRTPAKRNPQASSSPFPMVPSSSVKDYSSELDFSSPPGSIGKRRRDEDEDGDENEEQGEDDVQRIRADNAEKKARKLKEAALRAEKKAKRPERTRTYEVVAVVRRKVVFALR